MAVTTFLVTAGVLLGILSGLGATGAWLFGALTAAATLTLVLVLGDSNELTIAEVACVALAGVAAYFGTQTEHLDSKLDRIRAILEGPIPDTVGVDFVVYRGEVMPTGDTKVYARIEPDSASPLAQNGAHDVGSHVRVLCAVRDSSETWYRIAGGDFLNSAQIKPAAHSGEKPPPRCP